MATVPYGRARTALCSSRPRRAWAGLLAAAGFSAALGQAAPARAQQRTFHLDRLEVPGAPDDGIGIFRPATQQRNIFYGQLALGYALRPLRTRNITVDPLVLRSSRSSVIQDQFSVYGSAGFQLLDRATLGVTFPVALIQTGGNPDYGTGGINGAGQSKTTIVGTGGPAVGDLRIDFRGVIARSEDRRSAFGAQLSLFAPTGGTANFGGNGGASALVMVNGEHAIKFITFVANLGVHFRPRSALNDPNGGSGLGIGNELRWALGAFVPLKDGKYRIGATFFGQTGIESDRIIGDTFLTKQNTPIEYQVEGRMKFGPAEHWWLGGGAGSRIPNAYGAPDLRIVALLGTYFPILDSDAKSPERKADLRRKWRDEHNSDRDHDGIPDDIDACPDDAEDHLGNDPNDGCPMPPDRDGDGIPDQYDKCPDQPEDKDGIDDGDGCPEEDADNDGVPDAVDACPKVPGKPSKDPKQNGCPTDIKVSEDGKITTLKPVQFAFGTANLLPASFPILQQVVDFLKANPTVKRMAVEGHTDNRGAADLNKRLSQERANSVMAWLSQHGIDAGRLEAHGYGMERPMEDNSTDEGRARNRRVEFKILDQEDTNKVKK